MIEFINIIKKADEMNVLKKGINNLLTHINGIPIEIRPFIQDGVLMGFDAFVNHSKRGLLNGVWI